MTDYEGVDVASVDVGVSNLDRLAPFVRLATEAEIRSRIRANAARDRVSSLRQQLTDAEREMAAAVRESESDQTFLREVWEHYRSEATAARQPTARNSEAPLPSEDERGAGSA